MVRSNSPSHSSRSKSGSHSSSRSRTRSRSRKKRYSSRSRSRSYSRSRSRERERNYPRDYRRDYRMNRGMRRPYGFRGRGRGYYHQGGGRFQHRGGFRPNWQNRQYSHSPRRGRSRSRTPKHRSASQRSRSKSHHSERSSPSRRSSSSRSSSRYSRSPVPSKKRSSQDKPGKKLEGGPTKDEGAGRQLDEKGDVKNEQTANLSSSKSLSDLKRTPAVIAESWIGIAAYNDTSPCSHRSPSPSPTPTQPSQSSSRSDTVSRQVASKISPPSLPLHRLHSMQHSPDGLLGHYSPSHDGPLYCTSPRRSPAKAFSASQSSRAFFPNSDEQDLPKAGKYLKRYTEEEGSRVYLHERGNGREKDAQKDRVQEKGRAERDGEWAEQGGLDLGGKKAGEKVPFLGDSPEVEEEDESQAYRQPYQFKVTSQVEQVKSYAVESRWNLDSQEESGKYKIKTFSKGERDYDRFGEDRTYKFKDTSYVVDRLGVNKGKYAEEGKSAEKFDEKITIKRDTVSPQQLRAEKLRELYEHGGLLQKTVDVRDKALLRDESLPRVKMVTNEACRPEVKVVYDDPSPGTSVASDRSLASALVHSVKREQEFRSIFDHIKGPQEYKSSAESFIQHIVSLVHHVTGHGSPGMCIEMPSSMLQNVIMLERYRCKNRQS